jgi:hypothetical protein
MELDAGCNVMPSPLQSYLGNRFRRIPPVGEGYILSFSNVWSAARLQGKSLWMKESLRQCIRPVCGEVILLAMMRYAAYLSYKTPRLFESHLRNQVSGTPF